MKYFPNVTNLYINGDDYLKGFLGLDWLPSDHAKKQVDDYEKKVAALLFGLWKTYSSAWILYEIATANPKRVDIVPAEFAPDAFKNNQSGGDTSAKTGTKDNNYVDATKRGEPGKMCLPETKSDRVAGTGSGASAVVAFQPEKWGGAEGPGSAADEILIHELVHANRIVRGVRNVCYGAPRDWNDYEEFVAVTLCNVFSSETNRKLRFGHGFGFKELPADQSTSAGFLSKYKSYLEPIKQDHPHLFSALKRSPGIRFNPFALM